MPKSPSHYVYKIASCSRNIANNGYFLFHQFVDDRTLPCVWSSHYSDLDALGHQLHLLPIEQTLTQLVNYLYDSQPSFIHQLFFDVFLNGTSCTSSPGKSINASLAAKHDTS